MIKTEKEIEISHIAQYFPYGLKAQCSNLGILEITDISISNKDYPCWATTKGYNRDWNYDILTKNNCQGRGFILSDITPILRPLSDLVNEIIIDGHRFIPAIELANISIKIRPLDTPFVDKNGNIVFDYKIKKHPFGKVLKVTNFETWVVYLSFNEPFRASYFILQKLFEWHFDVFGLIEKGLAIDINSL